MGIDDRQELFRWLSTTDAAVELGVNNSRVRQLILEHRLPATKIGKQWLVQASDLDKVRQRKNGRPRKAARRDAAKQEPHNPYSLSIDEG